MNKTEQNIKNKEINNESKQKVNPKLKNDKKMRNIKNGLNNDSNINLLKDNDISKNNKITKYNLSEKIIEEIKSTNGKTKIHIYDDELKIFIKYTYKFKTANNIFFQYNKRPLCNGNSKYDLKKQQFCITRKM